MGVLVSTCIPCRNADRFLAETLDSVLAQNGEIGETIVVDGGSSDRSVAVARSFERHGVRVISEGTPNAAASRNRAFQEAKGTFVRFLDADDLLAPDTTALQLERLRGAGGCIASSEWGRFYLSPADYRAQPDATWCDLSPVDWLAHAFRGARPMMQCGMFLIPRELIEGAGGWDERLTLIDDFEFFTRLFLCAEEIRFTPGARLLYRSGNERSLSAQRSKAHAESAFLSIQLALDRLLAAENSPRTRTAAADVWQAFAYDFAAEQADLAEQAATRSAELGGSDLPFPGGPIPQAIARLLGWRFARRLQARVHAVGYLAWHRRRLARQASRVAQKRAS